MLSHGRRTLAILDIWILLRKLRTGKKVVLLILPREWLPKVIISRQLWLRVMLELIMQSRDLLLRIVLKLIIIPREWLLRVMLEWIILPR